MGWIGFGLRRSWTGLSLVGVVPSLWVRTGSGEWFCLWTCTLELDSIRFAQRFVAAAAPPPYRKISVGRARASLCLLPLPPILFFSESCLKRNRIMDPCPWPPVSSLCSSLVPASSTCVCGLVARAIYSTAQLAQAADAAPNRLAQIFSCSTEQCSS